MKLAAASAGVKLSFGDTSSAASSTAPTCIEVGSAMAAVANLISGETERVESHVVCQVGCDGRQTCRSELIVVQFKNAKGIMS